jgi:hypothetical protein
VLDAALSHSGDGSVFAAYLHSASSREIAELRLGKKSEQLSSRPRSCTARSTAAPTARPRSASPMRTSTKPGRPAC